ncbi:MAG TPA: hypothetical protein VFB38_24365 [Chthonomonadaceae bacterium]|jgi:hypothetical protein|nr:hypothetical protein [Chthonomonadaceae bacterium]
MAGGGAALRPDRSLRLLGIVCLSAALALWALSFPLHSLWQATRIGGFALLDGVACGTALAMVTRTRRPLFIYGWLGVAALTLWPIWIGWPPDPLDAPNAVLTYLDLLRLVLYVLGLPYPFARLGYHAPDPRPSGKLPE